MLQQLHTSHKVRVPMLQRDPDEEVSHFSLDGLLPAGQTLAFCITLGTLSLMVCKDDRPYLLRQEQFTTGEICVLLPVMEAYPYYCPNEVLCACFYSGRIRDIDVEQSRKHLREAREAGIWDKEMRPVRNSLSRTRLKLHTLGLEVSSIQETGYILRRQSIERSE
jgi:hypothetical protein